MKTLTCEDVVAIHESLVADFVATNDPISPPGVRSMTLLESAVARQHTALGTSLKYADPVSNAATLLYGICSNHPFHNGNKRTALVAMLVHLDDNRLALWDTTQSELFSMILGVAEHTLGVRQDTRRRSPARSRRSSDNEVSAIVEWIKRRVDRLTRGERQLSFRELRRILQTFGYFLETPKKNYIDLVRHEERPAGLLRKGTRIVSKHIGTIAWPGEHEVVGTSEIKRIRRMLSLTEADGVDSSAFYDRSAVIDGFVNKYRTLLRRLARR